MKKNWVKLLSALACLTLAVGFASCGENDGGGSDGTEKVYSKGLEYALNEDGESYSLVGIGTCEDTDLVIPSTYDGLPITTIGERAFSDCGNLTEVVIPDSVTTIDWYAFYSCESLTSVVIGDSVTTIGGSAFYGCYSLTEFVIPDSVTTIGECAFNYCGNLTEIIVDENNDSYKDMDGNLYTKDGTLLLQYAIGKTATSFTIPDSVTSIGNGVFSGCRSLKEIVIPNRVTTIGSSAFMGCKNLTEIVIPKSVTTIGMDAFSSCDRLTSVTFEDTSTWYVDEQEIDVTDPSANAENFYFSFSHLHKL